MRCTIGSDAISKGPRIWWKKKAPSLFCQWDKKNYTHKMHLRLGQPHDVCFLFFIRLASIRVMKTFALGNPRRAPPSSQKPEIMRESADWETRIVKSHRCGTKIPAYIQSILLLKARNMSGEIYRQAQISSIEFGAALTAPHDDFMCSRENSPKCYVSIFLCAELLVH